MKTSRNIFVLAFALFIGGAIGRTMVVKYNAYLVNEEGLAYDNNYPLNLNSYQIDNLAFTSVASSQTFNAVTFTDGQKSTGTITIADNTVLSTAAASDYLTVITTFTIPSGSSISINGFYLVNGIHWDYDPNLLSTGTAISIMRGINTYIAGVTASTGASSTVYATATVMGSYGNNMTMTSYTSSITVNSANFTGGRDSALLTIGQKSYTANIDYQVGAGSTNTAVNLATAINGSSTTYKIVASTGAGSTVFTTSTVVGLSTNYVVSTSSQAALTIGGSTVTVTGLNGRGIGRMWGGTDSAYNLSVSTTIINISSHGLTLGLPVLYSTTSSNTYGTGLTDQATYYVIPINANSISLATTSALAVSGKAYALTVSSSAQTADTFTLTPLAISGTPGFLWQVSNDGDSWYDYTTTDQGVSISSVTMSSYVAAGTTTIWDLGPVGYSYIRLKVKGPTAGAIKLKVIGNGKNTSR